MDGWTHKMIFTSHHLPNGTCMSMIHVQRQLYTGNGLSSAGWLKSTYFYMAIIRGGITRTQTITGYAQQTFKIIIMCQQWIQWAILLHSYLIPSHQTSNMTKWYSIIPPLVVVVPFLTSPSKRPTIIKMKGIYLLQHCYMIMNCDPYLTTNVYHIYHHHLCFILHLWHGSACTKNQLHNCILINVSCIPLISYHNEL